MVVFHFAALWRCPRWCAPYYCHMGCVSIYHADRRSRSCGSSRGNCGLFFSITSNAQLTFLYFENRVAFQMLIFLLSFAVKFNFHRCAVLCMQAFF